MFRKRRNSQKPDEHLYMEFKHSYGHQMERGQRPAAAADGTGLNQQSHPRHSGRQNQPIADFHSAASQNFQLDHPSSGHLEYTHQPEQGFLPQGLPSDWKTRPSPAGDLLSTFKDITNPAMWTPTPTSGISTHQVDFGSAHHGHLPPVTLGLETPRSASMSGGLDSSHPGHFMGGQYLDPSHFSHAQTQSFFPPQAFNNFAYPHGGPDFLSFHHHGIVGNESLDPGDLNRISHVHPAHASSTAEDVAPYVKKEFERQGFRFKAILHDAPTALIQHQGEKPVAYLNKSQKYRLQLTDLHYQPGSMVNSKYRTWVRVTFDDDQQRERPEVSWQLWKEGRGMKEAHEHEGLLRAIEYADPREVHPDDQYINVHFRDFRFDGFYVDWTPREDTGAADCALYVRFNFLSTDFSHSKGVKGIPVRLCARTEVISNDESSVQSKELSYCKIKLFRDHGAERKLANDKAHVRKLRDKYRQQKLNQKLSREKKRKRCISIERAAKRAKHDRNGSVSSSDPEVRSPPDSEDTEKESAFEMQLDSSHTTNYFYLRGDNLDDPDISPVQLSMDFTGSASPHVIPSLNRQSTQNTSKSDPSPGPSNMGRGHSDSAAVYPTPIAGPGSRQHSSVWPGAQMFHDTKLETRRESIPHQLATPDGPVKISRAGGIVSDQPYIEAVGINPTYEAPLPKPSKPVACFYIRPTNPQAETSEPYYLAVYLYQRTLENFIVSLVPKCGVKPDQIRQVFRIMSNGLQVKVDDDVVEHITEGQDMLAEFETFESENDDTDYEDSDEEVQYSLVLRF